MLKLSNRYYILCLGYLLYVFIICVVGIVNRISILIYDNTMLRSKKGIFTKITKIEKLIMGWLTFNGLLLLTLELYLVFKPHFYKDDTGNIFAEIKEYSKGDYRYLHLDPTTVAREAISVFIVGPTNLLAVFAIASHKSYKHILPLTVSLVEIYGVVIFIMTAILERNNFSSSQYYYYAYFVGANFPWALIPSLIFIRSWKMICEIQGTNKIKVQ
ncbi:probable 3-beta-hydroxysteroid-Delta(8),Delta(7)-isomerase [Amaranthus tricolor]|uniref:probable 3-beta-hydroxysteroid-Delta(8),Delta(7)-isomerase n=1 Tax=Amaranthus tricolor TaxID=29722 RepID=UPI0025856C4F|nr:probable 3-beta-hydroxysteroid-Delta(8),Delta(7)-isomerase [Amaranthus tricolor]